VLRVAKRLGLLEMDVPWAKADAVLESSVPDDLKYDAHVQLVVHGRDVCKSRGARCDDCVLRYLPVGTASARPQIGLEAVSMPSASAVRRVFASIVTGVLVVHRTERGLPRDCSRHKHRFAGKLAQSPAA
jgi:hypothetical protein